MTTATDGRLGANLVAGEERRTGTDTFRGRRPRTGEPSTVTFSEASDEEIAAAVAAATEAFRWTRSSSDDRRAALLRAIATGLEADGSAIIATADAETALGEIRLQGELARTTGQLRAFADLVEEGSYRDVIIDTADGDRQPPRPDLRRSQIPIGPVAVFGASNFPLAFSVPGGDTAAALAAGCPVVVKAHPSHPETSERCGRVIAGVIRDDGWPAGTFSLLHGRSTRVGERLVTAEGTEAVAFTGSERGGRALFDLAAARPRPIPVYAEMGSVNPIFVTPSALEIRGAQIAAGFAGSMTMGAGQFCTKPGLIFVPRSSGYEAFVETLITELQAVEAGCLLNESARDGLDEQVRRTSALPGVEVLLDGGPTDDGGYGFAPALLSVDAGTWRRTPELRTEHFGPVAVVVLVDSTAEMVDAAWQLAGNLTATVQAEDDHAEEAEELFGALRERAGRLLWNGYPTGVAVTAAMHHGGPYPAATVAAQTSVGTTAIRRFLRPVTYQGLPQALLPAELRDDNPRGILRLVDGRYTRAGVGTTVDLVPVLEDGTERMAGRRSLEEEGPCT